MNRHGHCQTPTHPPCPSPFPSRDSLTFFCAKLNTPHHSVPLRQKFISQVVRAVRSDRPIIDTSGLNELEETDFVVEACITRTLPPALTLECGLDSIKEAVNKLKLNPPANGVFRFQVAVPPSSKTLKWFCCQPSPSSKVFPLFFISKEEMPTYKSLCLNETRGVFGIGAAAYFTDSSSSHSKESQNSLKRYLMNESTLITAYGFVDVQLDSELSSMKKVSGSYHFFIPQIELAESEDASILSATLVWDEASGDTFEKEIISFESCLSQATSCMPHSEDTFSISNLTSTIKVLNLMASDILSEVLSYALPLGTSNIFPNLMQLREASSSSQFCLRLSAFTTVSNNMLDPDTERNNQIQNLGNVNVAWASLIIEECTRLGLTYFCIAPGSRSSPLAIAASSHPLTRCMVCFDERSLAYHAVGYARGSHRPAVVITTSGTAVSNLFPAVVEASQDFVPLLLLTADRPSELLDVGANQAINQAHHFGSFTRHFFNLPEPTDEIPARLVLTALDSAVYHATSIPYGPVHVNCPFREPLDNSPKNWKLSCLKGLDLWMSNGQPFTKYIHIRNSQSSNIIHSQMAEVVNLVQGFDKGLLLLGAIHCEDDIWAALLLAKHLQWPVVADVLSGLRLRRLLTSFHEFEDNILFVDHLDHALIANSIKSWIEVDGIVQIGSRITSKRISQLVEKCFPCPYILVERHSYRHDPSHMISHRIQSTVSGFANILLKIQFQNRSNSWRKILQDLNRVVAEELSFQILAETSLTEPHVAHMISEALSDDHAIFLGNSMAIRDLDMYGCNWGKVANEIAPLLFNSKLPYQLIRASANRGASGIDGLLSTSAGFAVGSNKRVICLIGDLSFLHDTNGLAILNQRMSRKPMTIIVLNNHGGAIFSLLPIANNTETEVLNQYFYTSHNISLGNLCGAHGMKHVKVQSKKEFQDALHKSQYEESDSIIEVESSIHSNAITHSTLQNFSSQAADHALGMFLRFLGPSTVSPHCFSCKVMSMEYSLYRLPLKSALTSTVSVDNNSKKYRQGFILFLYLEGGTTGLGEVAPIEIHEENLIDVEEQLGLLIHVVKGAHISHSLPLLKGSFSSWIWNELGIPSTSIFPSVRCGLEMAILNALAARQGISLLSLLSSQRDKEILSENHRGVRVCALMDPNGTAEEVAQAAQILVDEGHTAIKLKVARGAGPTQDAAFIQAVRKKVGNNIELRADANRKWTYEEAICFAGLVKNCNLQYIEEPVQDTNDIIKFCEETELPVALDETIDECHKDPIKLLAEYCHPGIVAAVIKPSMLSGFEKSTLVARWAQKHGKMAVISSTFESGVGLSSYIIFSQYIDIQNISTCRMMGRAENPCPAHGLGTYKWLAEDVTTEPLNIHAHPNSGYVEASVDDADRLIQKFQTNESVIERKFMEEKLRKYHVKMVLGGTDYSVKVLEIGRRTDNVLVFLHGFLGSSEDWIPIMKSISGSARCISIDLPGHGESMFQKSDSGEAAKDPTLSIEIVAHALSALLLQISSERITLVGYSMGARIALYMALKFPDMIKGTVLISGSPGLKDESARKIRRAQDDSRARLLDSYGLELFLDSWYSGGLWKSLRSHSQFSQIVGQRLKHGNEQNLSKALSELSIGRQLSLWEDLKHCQIPVLLIVGQRDEKFKKIAQQMSNEINRGISCQIAEVSDSGHAVHLENPLLLVRALRQFFTSLNH